jgi:PadR family transcriptional regulator PadR
MTDIDTRALDRELKKGSGERRRRFYKVTATGNRVLAAQIKTWETFVEAVRRITGAHHA